MPAPPCRSASRSGRVQKSGLCRAQLYLSTPNRDVSHPAHPVVFERIIVCIAPKRRCCAGSSVPPMMPNHACWHANVSHRGRSQRLRLITPGRLFVAHIRPACPLLAMFTLGGWPHYAAKSRPVVHGLPPLRSRAKSHLTAPNCICAQPVLPAHDIKPRSRRPGSSGEKSAA